MTENYIFTSINEDAEIIEFYDYNKKLNELKLFSDFPFFKLIINEYDLKEKLNDIELSNVCGLNIDDIEVLRDEELLEYRLELLKLVQIRLNEENQKNMVQENLAAFESIYCPNVEIDSKQLKFNSNNNNSPVISDNLKISDKNSSIIIKIYEFVANIPSKSYLIHIPVNYTPENIINEFIKIKKK